MTKTLKRFQELAVQSGVELFTHAKGQLDAAQGDAASRAHAVNANGYLLIEAPTGAGKMIQLIHLPENWDSYGAKRVNFETVNYALNSVLAPYMQASTPAPAVVPLNTGGVLLEWHSRQIDLEVRVEAPGQVHMYFADAKTEVETEGDLGENLIPLLTAISKLTQRA